MKARESLCAEAYFLRSTMAHMLEALEPGTPVWCGAQGVGTVRAVYAEGDARSAELVVVHWTYNRDDDVAVPAVEIASIDAHGVTMMNADPTSYAFLPPFDAARFPTVHPLI